MWNFWPWEKVKKKKNDTALHDNTHEALWLHDEAPVITELEVIYI